MNEIVGGMLNKETINELIEGADIDGDNQIDYKQHLNLVANTLLNLNSSKNQVFINKVYYDSL